MHFNWYEWKVPEPDVETRLDNPILYDKWLRDENEVVVEMACSDMALARRERKVHKDLLFVLGSVFRNKVKDRQITHPKSPQFMLELQASLNHPIFKSPETPEEMKRKVASVKEKDIMTVKYTRRELRDSPHPEMHPVNIKDQTEAQRMREEFKRKIIAEPDGHSMRKKFEYTGTERGYKEVEEEEVLEYKFARIDKG